MNTRMITILIVALLISLGAIFFLLTAPENENTNTSEQTTIEQTVSEEIASEETATEEDVVAESYTAEQVESHNSKDDCWTIISGSVYDITSYVARHPGGDDILRACGEDATTMFNSRNDENGEGIGSGTPHSSSAEQQLAQLKIGTLAP